MLKVVFAFQPGWAAFSLGMQHDVVLYQIAAVVRSTLHFALLIAPLHLYVYNSGVDYHAVFLQVLFLFPE
jgi:hypothetical protein